MAGCSSITTANFQFKIFISIVNTIVVFCFQEKEKMFQKKKNRERERFRRAQNMNLWSANIGSNMIKTWAKESKDSWFKHAQNLDQQRRKKNQL